MPPAPPAQEKTETKVVVAAPKPRLNKATIAMMEARQKAAREMKEKQEEMKKEHVPMVFTKKASKAMTNTNRQPLHAVKAQTKPSVETVPVKAVPANVFKAKPMPAFYKKAPAAPVPAAKSAKGTDENAPKTESNVQPVKRDFSRLFKPTAASKSAAVEKVVKTSAAKSPFKNANANAVSAKVVA